MISLYYACISCKLISTAPFSLNFIINLAVTTKLLRNHLILSRIIGKSRIYSSDVIYIYIYILIYILREFDMIIDYTSIRNDNLRTCITCVNKFHDTKMLIMNYADNLTAKFRGRERSMRCTSAC